MIAIKLPNSRRIDVATTKLDAAIATQTQKQIAAHDAAAAAAKLDAAMQRNGAAGATPSAYQAAAPLPLPLPTELEPVEPLPLEALPDAFRPWVADVADRMQCPPDFVAVPMLVAASMLVARRVAIHAQARTDWRERANLWALLVGRPGTMKSPAMQQALAPVERMEARAAQGYSAAMESFKVDLLAHKLRCDAGEKTAKAILAKNRNSDVTEHLVGEEPAPPPWPRYLVNDLTYQKLGALLAENPDGVLSVRDEMRGLFLDLAREEQASARAFYLQAWSGGRYTFDRIGRGTVTVEDARLSLIGCIQPGPLADLLAQARRGAADDGMLDRFLIAWPDSHGEWREVDRWPDTPAKGKAWSVFDRLDTFDALASGAQQVDPDSDARALPVLRFADEAREVFSEWRFDFEKTIKAADNESLEGALSKFRHHVPALALVLHIVDGGTGPVKRPATMRALTLADYFESHARRLHGSARRQVVRAASALLAKAKAGALTDPFTAREVYRNDWARLTERDTVQSALEMLTARGWLSESNMSSGQAGGRPTTVYSLTEGARHG